MEKKLGKIMNEAFSYRKMRTFQKTALCFQYFLMIEAVSW